MQTTKKPFKLLLGALVLALLAGGGFWGWRRFKPAAGGATAALKAEKYQCPMHPQVVRDHPGDCPICHMHLVKVQEDELPAAAAGVVAGKAGFTLSPQRQQLIGVKTTAVEIRPLSLSIRMPGRTSSGRQVLAQLLEIDAGSVRPGMRARLQGPQGGWVDARVEDVDSSLDSLTRSFGVTLQAASSAPWMRSGAFCQVLVEAPLGKRLAVPEEAVLDTGLRQVVFVADGMGHFEPREVVLGLAGDGWVEVTRGLKAGETVVSSANFLIDSESRFKAALKAF